MLGMMISFRLSISLPSFCIRFRLCDTLMRVSFRISARSTMRTVRLFSPAGYWMCCKMKRTILCSRDSVGRMFQHGRCFLKMILER